MRRHTAEFFVVNQFFDRRILATHRTLRIFSQFELAELHGPGVEVQQTVDQQILRAENDLDRFVRLNGADNARQNTKHATFRARRNEPGRRRLGIKTAITRALLGPKHARLTFEPEYRTVHVWLSTQHTRIVDE